MALLYALRMKRSASNSITAKAAGEDGPSADLGGRILELLRERILDWSYPPGHHLGEIALCAEFEASRIPVREALRVLTEQGLVDKIPNQGCFVKQPDVESLHQVYDMRLALELFVVESLATAKRKPLEWLATQKAYWEPLMSVKADETVDRNELVDSDTAFHLGLCQALGNQPIFDALRKINARLRFVRLSGITNPHRIQETAGEHMAIIDALENSDVEKARRTLRQNINHSRNKVEIAIARALMRAHENKG